MRSTSSWTTCRPVPRWPSPAVSRSGSHTSGRRASGQLLELGPGDLAFSADEVARLLEVVAGDRGPDDRGTRSWPRRRGGRLVCTSHRSRLRRHGSKSAWPVLPVAAATTVDVTAQFIRDEVLVRAASRLVRFLRRRVAVLEVMSGPLCDAVLHADGSDRVLQSISRSNLLVVPIDASGSWYRCHMLLRTALLDELANQEHDLVPVLHARASAWWEAAGSIDPAVRHALAAGDTPRAAELAAGEIIPAYYSGRLHVSRPGWPRSATPASTPTRRWPCSPDGSLPSPAAPPRRPAGSIASTARDGRRPASRRAVVRVEPCHVARASCAPMGSTRWLPTPSSPPRWSRPWSLWRTIALGVLATARWMQGDLDQARLTYAESIDQRRRPRHGCP